MHSNNLIVYYFLSINKNINILPGNVNIHKLCISSNVCLNIINRLNVLLRRQNIYKLLIILRIYLTQVIIVIITTILAVRAVGLPGTLKAEKELSNSCSEYVEFSRDRSATFIGI